MTEHDLSRYSKGKIYKIVSDNTDKIYIGSTCLTLSQRLSGHKSKHKRFIEGKDTKTRSSDILKNRDIKIILIENYPCKNKDELLARERYWLEQNREVCFNKCFRLNSTVDDIKKTKRDYVINNPEKRKESCVKYYERNKDKVKKYANDNKEKIKERQKAYHEANKEKIKAYREANKDKIKAYSEANKDKIKAQKKAYYEANEDKIKAQAKTRYEAKKQAKSLTNE